MCESISQCSYAVHVFGKRNVGMWEKLLSVSLRSGKVLVTLSAKD